MNQNTPDIQPPELEPGSAVKDKPMAPVVPPVRVATPASAARKAPKPPALLPRVAWLVLRPEQWAEAARYRLSATVMPMIFVCLLAAAVMGVTAGTRTLKWANAFVAGYDASHPAMVYKNGTLAVQDPTPANLEHFPIRFENDLAAIVIDPTGHKTLSDYKQTFVTLVTDHKVFSRRGGWETSQPLSELAGRLEDASDVPHDKQIVINAASLKGFMTLYHVDLGVSVGLFAFGIAALQNIAWCFLIALFVMPVVAMGAPRLVMPRSVAFRIALAGTIPLVAVGALMEAIGFTPSSAMPPQFVPIFWFFAAAGVAFWAGALANQMYSVQRVRRRGT